MTEVRFFPDGIVPEVSTAEWHAPRERAPHLEQTGPHRNRLLKAYDLVHQVAAQQFPGVLSVADFGCGDGGLLSLVKDLPNVSCWGYEFTPANVAGAKERGLEAVVHQLDFVNQRIPNWGDLTILTEVLEHMDDPHLMCDQAATFSRWLVASSPWNETQEMHVGYHVWAWDMQGYAQMIQAAGWEIERHEQVDQFQLVLARSTR